jgi:hypothetical protein
MPVTQQLAQIPFPDNTTATVSWTLAQVGGAVQSFNYLIPVGHQVTVQVADGNGNVLWTHTEQGDGTNHAVVPTVSITAKQVAAFQIAFSGQ